MALLLLCFDFVSGSRAPCGRGLFLESVITGCKANVKSLSLAMHLGLTAPVDHDLDLPGLEGFLRRQTVSPSFSVQIKIILVVAKYMPLLSRASGDHVAAPFVRLFENDLDAARSETDSDDEDFRSIEMTALNAKLHLYALVIVSAPSTQQSELQIVLQKAFYTAIHIIRLLTADFCSTSPQDSKYSEVMRRQRYLPKNTYRGLLFATTFLLKFYHHPKDQPPSERQHVISHVKRTLDLFRANSLEPLDECDRATKMLEALVADIPEYLRAQPLSLTYRMGFSVVLDAISKASRARGKTDTVLEAETTGESSTPAAPENNAQRNAMFDATFIPVPPVQHDWGEADFSWDFWGDQSLENNLRFEVDMVNYATL